MEETAGGIVVAVIAGIIAIFLKKRSKKSKNTEDEPINIGKIEFEITYLNEKLETFQRITDRLDKEIKNAHFEYDSILKHITEIRLSTQKQMSDIKERLAKIEGFIANNK